MRTIFTRQAPVADVVGGLVELRMEGSNHPIVAAPICTVRQFCEITIRKLNQWEAEQRGGVVPLRK